MVASSRWMVATGRPVARLSSLIPLGSPGSASASSSSRARSTDWTPSLPRRGSSAAAGCLVCHLAPLHRDYSMKQVYPEQGNRLPHDGMAYRLSTRELIAAVKRRKGASRLALARQRSRLHQPVQAREESVYHYGKQMV